MLSCVMSVTVSPIILLKIKTVCPGIPASLSMNIFHDVSRKENIHGKRSWNARDNKVLI